MGYHYTIDFMVSILKEINPDNVIVGDANGIDKLIRISCNKLKIPCEVFIADWDKYGKMAGPIRNKLMLNENPDLVLAIHPNLKDSKGTMNCIKQALDRNIPVKFIGDIVRR